MTELHEFLRDLDDPDDFSTLPAALSAAGSASSSISAKAERAPKVYGFDTRSLAHTLPDMLRAVREACESESHPLGRSARQWASSGFSRVPNSNGSGSTGGNNRGSLSSVSAVSVSAKLSPFRARAPSTDSLSLDSRSSDDTFSQQSHAHTLSLNPMREKLSLSLFMHEISKLLLNTQEINAQYCKMKEELVSFSPKEILSLAYENTVISLFRNNDVFDNVENARNNAFLYNTQRNEAIAREYEALREDAVRRFVSFQEAHRCDILNDLFLYDNEHNSSFEQYVEEHSEITRLYSELFAPSSAAAAAGHGEKKTGSQTHNKSAVRVELSRVFFFSWLWNVKIVLVSLARQRRCLLPSAPMHNRFSASANNNNNNNKLVSNNNNNNNRRASASSSTADPSAIHSEMDAAFINAKYLFSLARFYNMNATRVIRNAREYDDLLAHYHGHYRNNHNGINNNNNTNEKSDESNNSSAIVHAKFTRSYGSTPLLETETITVHESPLSQSPTHTQTVYRRSVSLCFDERRKKNDPNTSVFCDETNAWMSLCQRFQRENLSIGLFRNILTSKKLSLSYYSTNEYVLQGLFKIFLVECVKYPSYLLLHAMVMDLIEGTPSANNGAANGAVSNTPSPRSSFTAAGTPPTGFTGRTSTIPTYLTNNNSNVRGSFTGGSPRSPNTGSGANGASAGNAGPWSWARLVPRRKIDNSGSSNASVSAVSSPVPAFARSVGIADNSVHSNYAAPNNNSNNNNNNILSMHSHAGMRDYQLDDVLLPAAVEGADDANQELLAIYNLFSSMPYFYDQISQSPPSLAENTAASASETLSAADVKWMLLDKEFHILSTWLSFRAGIDIAKSASANNNANANANSDATSSPDSSPSSPADSSSADAAAAFTLPEDPQQLSAWMWKTLFPRLVDLLFRWYGVNILDTFDHLREPAGM